MSYNLLPNGPIAEVVRTATAVFNLTAAQPITINQPIAVTGDVPDIIKISAAYAGFPNVADLDTSPVYNTVNGDAFPTQGLVILSVLSDDFMSGVQQLCILNQANTYNPEFEFQNLGRENFRNKSFRIRVVDAIDNDAIDDGFLILTMKFLRYRTPDERRA